MVYRGSLSSANLRLSENAWSFAARSLNKHAEVPAMRKHFFYGFECGFFRFLPIYGNRSIRQHEIAEKLVGIKFFLS